MFSKEAAVLAGEDTIFVNSVQETPKRVAVYAVNRCEDQVIGFEFVTKSYNKSSCCPNELIHLCVPIELVSSIPLEKAYFLATDDPCYKSWIVNKEIDPHISIQRNTSGEATGILVRFFANETCCYPHQMAFRLYGLDQNDCKFSLASGLLIFK